MRSAGKYTIHAIRGGEPLLRDMATAARNSNQSAEG